MKVIACFLAMFIPGMLLIGAPLWWLVNKWSKETKDD